MGNSYFSHTIHRVRRAARLTWNYKQKFEELLPRDMSFLSNLNRGLCEYDIIEDDSDQERGKDR